MAAPTVASESASPPTSAKLVPWTDGPQPTLILPVLNGGDAALSAYKGQPVVVHFFATWCEPCREELPALNRLTERGAGSLKVISISVAEVDVRVQRFVQAMPVNFPVLLDRDRAAAKAWRVSTLPTTFILDSKLTPRLVVEADYPWDTIDIPALLAQIEQRTTTGQPNKQ